MDEFKNFILEEQRLLIGDEGSRLKVYDDKTGLPIGPESILVGHPTIGVGRCLDTHGISEEEQQLMFDNDTRTALNQALAMFTEFRAITRPRQLVIVAMLFELGFGGFNEFKDMIRAIHASDWSRAADEMLQSRWSRALPDRSSRMAKMMREG